MFVVRHELYLTNWSSTKSFFKNQQKVFSWIRSRVQCVMGEHYQFNSFDMKYKYHLISLYSIKRIDTLRICLRLFIPKSDTTWKRLNLIISFLKSIMFVVSLADYIGFIKTNKDKIGPKWLCFDF